jgi:hypothetical protein
VIADNEFGDPQPKQQQDSQQVLIYLPIVKPQTISHHGLTMVN